MRCYGEDGDARAMAIEQSVNEMQVAGPAAARTNGEPAGQMRLGTSCKDRNLFVPHMDPLYLAVAANGIGQAIQAVADDSIDPLQIRFTPAIARVSTN